MRIAHPLVSSWLCAFVSGAAALLPGPARADRLEQANYRDIRFMGRGGTGVSSATDSAALFYNPAGLAFNDAYSIELANPVGGTNSHVVESAKTGFSFKSDSTSLNDKFSPYLGKQLGAEYSIFPNLTVPYFGIGYFNVGSASMMYRNPVNPEFDVLARYSRGVILGAALPLTSNFAFGATVKYLRRSEIDSELTGGDLLSAASAAISNYLQTGSGWGVGLGVLTSLPVGSNSQVRLGTAIDDVGQTKLRNPKYEQAQVRPQMMVWNAGVSYEYESDYLGFKVLYDMRQLNTADISMTKKIHMGAELSFLRTDLRAGFNQGYYTVGLSSRLLPFLHFHATSYGEELDSSAGLRQNRVYLVGFTFGLHLKPRSAKKQRLNLDNIK